MKQEDITYEIVKSFDEDKVRHRLSGSERFLTLKKGHVYVFEFDLCHKSALLFNRFSAFKGMRYLIINLGDLREDTPEFSKIKCESIIALKIFHTSISKIPFKLFDCFPNIKYLTIYSQFKSGINNVDSILSLRKLKMLEFNDCFSEEHLNKFHILKKRGVEIRNVKKNLEY